MSALKEAINLQKRQISRIIIEVKKIIINKLAEKISNLSKNGQLKFIYNIPHYVFGFPRYNIDEISEYILQSLIKEGYCAFKVDSSKIFISWDIHDVNIFTKEKKKKKKQFESLLPIINIQ